MLDSLQEWSALCALDYPYLLPLLFGLAGLCIGSYLNVAIYRLPLGLSTNEPRRSFCPRCKQIIPWYFNLPVISWLLLRGKSACCKQAISPRYLLVELLTGALFVGVNYYYNYENVLAQILICVWFAAAIAIFFIDWEQMIVMPSLCVIAGLAGLALGGLAPWFASDGSATTASDGLIASVMGAAISFLLIKVIALLGRAAFGRKQEQFEQAQDWSMKPYQGDEDILLQIAGKEYLWSELFLESSHRLILKKAQIRLQGMDVVEGDITMTASHIILPNGTQVALVDYDSASGSCHGWQQQREAMGSGDAWIALAIGAFCGWQGFAVALVAGSFIGILLALVTRVSRGQPMPFGPCLLLGTLVYLLGWHQVLWNEYLSIIAR